MFTDPFDDGVSGGLIVAALDVEVIEQGLEDQWCYEGHPSFQQVDKGCVGAELFEDHFGEASQEEPYAGTRLLQSHCPQCHNLVDASPSGLARKVAGVGGLLCSMHRCR